MRFLKFLIPFLISAATSFGSTINISPVSNPLDVWQYQPTLGVRTTGTLQSKLDEIGLSVKDAPFYAVGDGVADDTAAIQAAVDYISTASPITKILYFPAGIYKITSQININTGFIYLLGSARGSRRMPADYPTGKMNASIILYAGNGNEAAIKVYNSAVSNYKVYRFGMENIGIKTRSAKANSVGLHLIDCENGEFYGVSVMGGLDASGYIAQGFTNALVLEGCHLMNFIDCQVSYNTTNQILIRYSARQTSTMDGLVFDLLDAYHCAGDSIRIEGSTDLVLKGYNFLERAQNSIHIVQPEKLDTKVIISSDFLQGTNNGDYDNALYIHDGIHEAYQSPRLLKVEATADFGATKYQLYVRAFFNGTINFWQKNTDYLMEYINGTNSHASTVCQISLNNVDLCGLQSGVVVDDDNTGKCQVLARGFSHVGKTSEFVNDTPAFVTGCLFDDKRANPQ